MERRFSVHAGGNTQALIRRRGRGRAWLIALALVSVAGSAEAKPKRRDAKVAFDRGVVAYQKGNFEAASEALAKSFDLERDVDTLFAWAQSERKLDHCEKAIELYQKLLALNLPAANKNAVELKLEECRSVVAQQRPKVEPAPVEPVQAEPEPAPVKPAPVKPAPVKPAPESAPERPSRVADRTAIAPEPPPVSDIGPAGRAWYRDPITLGLLGAGIAATGVGTGFLVSASALDGDSKTATTYDATRDLGAKARSRGNIGLIATGAGGALLIGGIVWIVTHRGPAEQHAITGWLAPGGGGLAVAGAF